MEALAAEMRRLSPGEHEQRTTMIGRLGMTIKELPWVRLEGLHKHRYGVLKAWVKGKSFKNGQPTSWASVKWRPIAGYSRHRWRHLLSIGGRWATHTVETLGWGWSWVNPRQFVHDIAVFNEEAVPTPLQHDTGTSPNVKVSVQDLEGFFPNINLAEVKDAVELALWELHQLNASWRYF